MITIDELYLIYIIFNWSSEYNIKLVLSFNNNTIKSHKLHKKYNYIGYVKL